MDLRINVVHLKSNEGALHLVSRDFEITRVCLHEFNHEVLAGVCVLHVVDEEPMDDEVLANPLHEDSSLEDILA